MGSLWVEVVKRLLTAFIAFIVILTVIFWAFRVAPDAEFTDALGRNYWTADQTVADDLSIGEPLIVQYVDYLGDILHGDLYTSSFYGIPVSDIALEAAKSTMILFAISISLSCLVGMCFERFLAGRTGSLRDRLGRVLAVGAFAVQAGGLGLLLQVWNVRVESPLAYTMGPFDRWLHDMSLAGLGDALWSLVLPVVSVVCVTSPFFWLILRQGRATSGSMERARGLTVLLARLKATGPMPAFFVSWAMLSCVVVQHAFSSSGLGMVMHTAFSHLDLVLLMGCMFVFALLVLIVSTAVEILLLLVPATAEPVAVPSAAPVAGMPHLLHMVNGVAKSTWSGLRRSLSGLASLAVLLVLVAIAVLAPVLSMVDGNPSAAENVTSDVLLDPSLTPSPETGIIHLLGTDQLGRDLYSMMLYGARGPLVVVGLLAAFTFLLGCGLGLIGAAAARLPARLVRVAQVLLRGVSYAFAAVSCVVILYVSSQVYWYGIVSVRTMGILEYSLLFALMYLGWAWEVVVVPAYRLSRTAMADGRAGMLSSVRGSLRLVVSRSLRAAKTATVTGLVLVTMCTTSVSSMIDTWPTGYRTWGGILGDAVYADALLAGPETFFMVPFVLLTLLGACAYIFIERLEEAAEVRPSRSDDHS